MAIAILSAFAVVSVSAATAVHDDANRISPNRGPRMFRFLWVPALAALAACAIPSSSTVYMIAASEAGEAVMQTPDAQEMMGDVKTLIKKRLREEIAE